MKKNFKLYESDILIVGSGAGGTALISGLVNKGYRIIVAEQGEKDFDWGNGIKERAINIYKKSGKYPTSIEGINYYRHTGIGGSVEISCANGGRVSEKYLSKLGLDINQELDEIEKEMKIQDIPDEFIGPNSKLLISAANDLGFNMKPMPKFIDFSKCKSCARCEVICEYDAKWSTQKKIIDYENNNEIMLLDGLKIEKIEIKNGNAESAIGEKDGIPVKIKSKIIILAAGGIGTPVILQNSNIDAGLNFFLDLYVNVYGKSKNYLKKREIPMSAVYADPNDDFVIAPYLDINLWFALDKYNMSKWFPGESFMCMMVKISDEASGRVNKDGTINKDVTESDTNKINNGADIAKQILIKSGAEASSIVVTKPKGAHPGGTAAIGNVVGKDLKVIGLNNLYITDTSVFPFSPGKPPILTIMALARKLGKSLTV